MVESDEVVEVSNLQLFEVSLENRNAFLKIVAFGLFLEIGMLYQFQVDRAVDGLKHSHSYGLRSVHRSLARWHLSKDVQHRCLVTI